MGEDAQQSSQSAQVTPQTAEFIAELAARLARLEAQRDRAQRMADLLDGAAGPEPPPGPRHRKPKRDRHGLRVIPGGLAALVPVAFCFHDGLAAAGVTAWQCMWRARRPHARWVVAALSLALAGITTVPATAADGTPPAHHTLICHVPRERHPDRKDGDRDDPAVVARLPVSCQQRQP